MGEEQGSELVEVGPMSFRALGLEESVTKEYMRKHGSVILGSMQGLRKQFAAAEHAAVNRSAVSMGQLILDVGLAEPSLAHLSLENAWTTASGRSFKHPADAPLLTLPADLWRVERPTQLKLMMRTLGTSKPDTRFMLLYIPLSLSMLFLCSGVTDINRAFKYAAMGKLPEKWAAAERAARQEVAASRGKSEEVRKAAFERHSDVMYRAGKAISGK